MGNYFNPVTELEEKGRRLEGQNYDELMGQLQEGEILVGLFDRYVFKCAPHLYSEDEFREFAWSYDMNTLGYFAVDGNKYFKNFDCPDKIKNVGKKV